eukprot:m.231087 g.231087  ORF g.231087 m.231087 type:complete len:773 (+) comp17063_c5_seq1:303-2621(+)
MDDDSSANDEFEMFSAYTREATRRHGQDREDDDSRRHPHVSSDADQDQHRYAEQDADQDGDQKDIKDAEEMVEVPGAVREMKGARASQVSQASEASQNGPAKFRFHRSEIKVEQFAGDTAKEMERMNQGQQLLNAADDGDVDAVRKLIQSGVDANFHDLFGTTGLLVAARKGNMEIIQILIAAGADPRLRDSRGVEPLHVALTRNHKAVAQLLLKAGADPLTAVTALTNVLEGVKDVGLRLLVQDDMLCMMPDIIPTCFRLSYQFNLLAQRQEERKHFYFELRDRCRDLAVNLLAACQDMWDVRRLLAEHTSLLGLALEYDQTLFVSHPYCQEYLKELWLGQYVAVYGASFFGILLKYLLFPVLFPYLLMIFLFQTPRNLQFSRLGDYIRLCHTPFVKFVGHMASFILFLMLLIITVALKSEIVPNTAEIVLAIWVCSLVFQEIREIYQTPSRVYLRSLWNWLDLSNQALYVVVFALRSYLYSQRDTRDNNDNLLFISNLIFAFAGLLSGLRFLNVLEAHYLLGPLQISIREILSDLFVFVAILLVFMIAFAVALTKVYEHLEDVPANELIISNFGDFESALRTMFWAIFGFFDLDLLSVGGARSTEIQVFGELLFGAYMVIVFVLLINLLIAIITNTYQRIVDNSDVVWKFARARLIREFQTYPAVPAPLNIVLEPIEFITRTCGLSVHSVVQVNTGHSSTDQAEESEQLRKLVSKLVERHTKQIPSSVDDADDISVTQNRPASGADINELRDMVQALLAKVENLEKRIIS